MYEICTRFISKYLYFSPFSPVLLFLVFLAAFFLIVVIGLEITKTNTSFLAFSFFLRIFAEIIAFFFAKKVFNMGKIFFFCFGNNVDICYKKILALTLFLSIIAPKTSLVVLIFFVRLMDRKLLFLTRYISKRTYFS